MSCTCSVYFYTNFQSWAREAKLTLRDKRQRTYRLLLHMTTQQILGLETRDNATCDDVTNIFLHVRETLLFLFHSKRKKWSIKNPLSRMRWLMPVPSYPFLHPSCPASVLSCICPVIHPSCTASVLSCI